MKRRLWLIAGGIIYWIGWPVSFLSLYFSRRARVLIVCKNEVLLTKNWMGGGDWHAPGGGLHRGESPKDGAVRELQEEIGLEVAPDRLQKLYEKRVTTRRKFVYYGHFFVLELPKKPKLQPDNLEISEIGWFGLEEISREKIGGGVLKEHLQAWSHSRRM